MNVIVYTHTHWDREWYKPFQEFRLRLVEVIDEVINQLDSNKVDCFYLDGQTIALEDYLEINPLKKDKIKELIRDKKFFVGPWYVLADEFLVSGESLIRNLIIGINQSKEFGCNDYVGYLPDSFGHISDMPRILKSFGINNAVVWRGIGNHKSEFIWKSQDASDIFTIHLLEGYFQDILNQNYSIQEKTKNIGKLLNKIKEFAVSDIILFPAGGDHLGIALNLNSQIEQINKHINGYTLSAGSIFDFINVVKAKNVELEEVQGEFRNSSRNPILPGTLSTRLYLKKANAKTTWKLNKLAESLYSHLEYNGLLHCRRNELEYAWKLLLKNHPHDSICGCSVDEVHREMLPRFEQVEQIADGLVSRCFHELVSRVEKGKLIVYNSSDYTYTGVLKVTTKDMLPKNLISHYLTSEKKFPKEILFDTQRVPVQEDVKLHNKHLIWVEDIPPHSIKIIDDSYKYSKHSTIVETGKTFIKNSRIIVKVNEKDGSLSLSDNDSGKEFHNLHMLYDYADKGDTYNFCPLKNEVPRKGIFIKSEIIEDNKLRGILRLFYEIEIPESLDIKEEARSIVDLTHVVIVDLIVHADSRRVEFKIMWENFSRDHILQLKFKFDEKVYKTLSENNFGLIERGFNPDYSLKENMPAAKNQELKTNTAPMQRFVWANGLGIITEGLSEYGIDKNELYITLLRSVGRLSRAAIDTRGVPAGPSLNTPEAQCLGAQKFRYAICAVDDPQKLFEEADQFMRCLLTGEGIAEDSLKEQEITNNLLDVNNHNIYTYSIKPPYQRDKKALIVRLMNISSENQTIKINSDNKFSKISEINSLEEVIEENIKFDKIKFKAYELKSFMLE